MFTHNARPIRAGNASPGMRLTGPDYGKYTVEHVARKPKGTLQVDLMSDTRKRTRLHKQAHDVL